MAPGSTTKAKWVVPVTSPVRAEFMDMSRIWASKSEELAHAPSKKTCYLPDGKKSIHDAHQTHLVRIDPAKTYDVSIWM